MSIGLDSVTKWGQKHAKFKRTVSNFLIFAFQPCQVRRSSRKARHLGLVNHPAGFQLDWGCGSKDTLRQLVCNTNYSVFSVSISKSNHWGHRGRIHKFLSDYNLTASIAMKPRMAPYSDGDTDLLTGMKRNSSLDLSVTGTMNIARGTTLILEAATEVTGEHNGQELDFSVRQFVPGFGTPVFLTAGVKRQNANLASFLYGVEASEEVATRRTYSTGTVLLPYISANTIYGLSDSISLFGNTGLTIYPKKVLNSPIINERTSLNLIGGLAFTF